MKKILLITLFDDNNIGNRLQNYALQCVLRRYDVEVTTVDNFYTTVPSAKERIKAQIKRILGFFWKKSYKESYKQYEACEMKRKANKIFDEKNIFPILRTSNQKVFESKWEEYDLVVAGSDQIWHGWRNDSKELPFYYLQFVPYDKRVAYAASFGFSEFPMKDIQWHYKGLLGMKYISCREQSGCELVEQVVGKKVQRVLDPTLLLDKNEWRKISEQASQFAKVQRKYIFLYFLGEITEEYLIKIREIMDESNIDRIINFSDCSNKEISSFGPSEFIYLIEHAEYVFTDSFHCTVFSLLFEKSFMVFRRKQIGFENMFGRIEDLLASVNKLDVIYDGTLKTATKDFTELYKNSIKYIEEILEVKNENR